MRRTGKLDETRPRERGRKVVEGKRGTGNSNERLVPGNQRTGPAKKEERAAKKCRPPIQLYTGWRYRLRIGEEEEKRRKVRYTHYRIWGTPRENELLGTLGAVAGEESEFNCGTPRGVSEGVLQEGTGWVVEVANWAIENLASEITAGISKI